MRDLRRLLARSMTMVTLLLASGLTACRSGSPEAQFVDLLSGGGLHTVIRPRSGSAPPSGAARLVASWDFEDASPGNWWIRTYGGRTRGGVTAETAHAGRHGFCLEAVDGGADVDAQLHIAVMPDTEYELDAYVRTVDLQPSSARVYGTFYIGEFSYRTDDNHDGNNPVRWHPELPMFRGTSDGWQPLRYAFRTTPRTRMLRIAASLGNWGKASGKLCFDDVRLSELGEPAAKPEQAVGGEVQMVAVGGEPRRGIAAYPHSEYRYALRVPAEGRLRVAAGIEDHGWTTQDHGVTFSVAVVAAGETHTIFSRRLDPAHTASDRAWLDVDLPLDQYRDRSVELAFRTESVSPAGTAIGATDDLAVWANPTVYVRRAAADRRREPNVFLITVDTLRADHLGCYGYARDTSPAIDALAKRSVLFEHVFTTIPRTTPALASLMTGLDPRAHGVMTLLDSLAESQTTLAERLAARGYVTGASVTHNVSRQSGLQQGFDTYADHDDFGVDDHRSRAEHITERATRWVSEHAGMKMFFWLHVWDPHFRYQPPAPYDDLFDPNGAAGFDLYQRLDRGELTAGQVYFHNDLTPPQLAHAIALYDGEIRYADTVVGSFLQLLKDLQLYDDALIIFTADHGESLGEQGYFFEHGEYLYDSTLHIPLIIKFPRGRHAGLRFRGKAMISDVMPTVLSVVAAPEVQGLAGRDLTGFLDGTAEPHPDCYAETGRRFFPENSRRYLNGLEGNWKSIRSGPWKLIEIPKAETNLYELYDTQKDPGETTNLYRPGDPQAKELTARLHAWLASFEEGAKPAKQEQREIDPATRERLRALGYMNR